MVNCVVLCVSLETLTNELTVPLNFAATKIANPDIRWNSLGSLYRVQAQASIHGVSQLCTGSISGVS